MMTHGALVHEYVSAITALGLTAADRPVHSLPLYHSAQMHVFLLPYLAVGAENTILDAPDAVRIFDLVETGLGDSLFAPPTVWIALANHPSSPPATSADCGRRSTGPRSCPSPSWSGCVNACHTWPSSTASGRARSVRWPPSWAPTSTRAAWTPAAGRSSSWRPASSTRRARTSPTEPPARSSTDRPSCARATGRSPRRPRRRSATAGSARATSPSATPRASSPSSTGSRTSSTPVASSSPPARSRTPSTPTPRRRDRRHRPSRRPLDRGRHRRRRPARRGGRGRGRTHRHAREKLAAFKAPKRVVFVDELPRNASGKILKRQLRDELA